MEPQKRPATILVADDDEDLRHALCSLLSLEGYEVIELSDGGSALELLADAADGRCPRPDLLLLDFCMPELSGIGLLRILRRFGSHATCIVITAFPDPSVEILALQCWRGPGLAQAVRRAGRPRGGSNVAARGRGRAGERQLPPRGSVNVKTAPRPGTLWAEIVPPCASTMPFAMASPRPAPARLAFGTLPEAIEHVRQLVRRDARPRVRDADDDSRLHLHEPRPGRGPPAA